jgi:hypothetical protein
MRILLRMPHIGRYGKSGDAAMQKREKPYDIDQAITLGRRTERTTIRKEHERGRVRCNPDSLGWVAHVMQDNGEEITFGITEDGFKELGGGAG